MTDDRWRGETLLQSTFSSKLLNLGPSPHGTAAPRLIACLVGFHFCWTEEQVHFPSYPSACQQVDAAALSSLCGFLRERRPLLVSLPRRPHQDPSHLPYATMRSLRANMLVNARLCVTRAHVSKGEDGMKLPAQTHTCTYSTNKRDH